MRYLDQQEDLGLWPDADYLVVQAGRINTLPNGEPDPETDVTIVPPHFMVGEDSFKWPNRPFGEGLYRPGFNIDGTQHAIYPIIKRFELVKGKYKV